VFAQDPLELFQAGDDEAEIAAALGQDADPEWIRNTQ
jgi:hypothetical protein